MSAAMRSLVIPVSDMGAAKKVHPVLGPHTDLPLVSRVVNCFTVVGA